MKKVTSSGALTILLSSLLVVEIIMVLCDSVPYPNILLVAYLILSWFIVAVSLHLK